MRVCCVFFKESCEIPIILYYNSSIRLVRIGDLAPSIVHVYPVASTSIYSDRIAPGHRDHRDACIVVIAGVDESKAQGQNHAVSVERPPARHGRHELGDGP